MKRSSLLRLLYPSLFLLAPGAWAQGDEARPMAGTQALAWTDDIASRLVDAADRFLLLEIERAVPSRERHWKRDASSEENYTRSIAPNRERFSRCIGIRDPRPFAEQPDAEHLGRVAENGALTVERFRWPVFEQVHGEGLLLTPKNGKPIMDIVVVPDPSQQPEQLAGVQEGLAAEHQTARILAERGCRVIVPTIINRQATHRKLSNREFLYRPAFELGRHIIGSEVEKVLAAIDWFQLNPATQTAVAGWGSGGLLAFYAAAVDPRIDHTVVSGYFGSRQEVWKEPADHNVFGLLEEFGDAEIATLILPRSLTVEPRPGPDFDISPGTGGKPGRLHSPSPKEAREELERAKALAGLPDAGARLLLGNLDTFVAPPRESPMPTPAMANIVLPDQEARHSRQMEELNRHYQWLLRESPYVRTEFMKDLRRDGSLDGYIASAEAYRTHFAEQVIGRFDYELGPPSPRTRLLFETDKVTAYEVVLDVFSELFAYGILVVPNDLKAGEARPAVVCQHGLEGRPQHVIGEEAHHYYKAFATKLAERGFVTFAPQNIYIFEDRFRMLQFKANAVKKTLFSLMVPQHEQITRWLGSLEGVDPERIAFYGLSYGGKSAMRIPPLVSRYCLSICSADFNEWVWKNASTRSPYSYVWTGEYEIFEFDLGSTFNYAEMAALIAPRPFMVERGHHDGVAPDETVAYEYAKVRRLYTDLGIPDRTAIEWFDGPHTINGQGTFKFLHNHLRWPEPTVQGEP